MNGTFLVIRPGDEVDVSREAIQLGYDDRTLLLRAKARASASLAFDRVLRPSRSRPR